MGYNIVEANGWCRLEVIKLLPKNASATLRVEVAADKRGDDSVAGY